MTLNYRKSRLSNGTSRFFAFGNLIWLEALLITMKFRPKMVKYGEFVQSIFNPLQPNERHELFYCSLFDPSSWEELEKRRLGLRDFQRWLGERVIELIKRKNQKFFRKYVEPKGRKNKEERKEYFLASLVYSEDLCNFMVASALRGKGVNIPFKTIGKRGFPDLVINVRGVPKAVIEIKRLIGCSNLKERIDNEVITELKRGKINKLFLLLIFPTLRGDDPYRVHQIISGCYVFEDYIQSKTRKQMRIRVLCKCVEGEYHKDSRYSFESLIETLVENLKKEKLL